MIMLDDFEEYWRGLAARLPGDDVSVMTVTATEEMAKEIRQLPDGATVLFLLPPATRVKDSDVGARDVSQCLVFLLRKYVPARVGTVTVLKETQRQVGILKDALTESRLAGNCAGSDLQRDSIDIQPETGLFGVFAGWSIAYRTEN